MFNTVLIPLNLNESPAEVESLVSFHRHFDTDTIYLFTVIPGSLRGERHARKKMETLAEACNETGMDVHIEIRFGAPAVEIINAADSLKADFIAIPWERKSVLQHALMGSVTKDVIRLSDKPIFIYKQWLLKKSDKLTTVIFAADFNPVEEGILPYLTYPGLAAEHLMILNVGDRAPDPKSETLRLEKIEEKMAGIEKKCDTLYERIDRLIMTGSPEKAIPRQARKEGADLIIIGKHGDGSTRQKVLGSTAENIVHRASCSVLVIPAKERGIIGYETD